jgi:two-component system, NtrC family, response regulator AtoC
MRILLVDDHAEVRQSLAAFIEQLGHTSLHADNGPDAMAITRGKQPDLVLSDLRMPGMNGLDLLHAVQDLQKPPPFALMTAFGDSETAITAMRMGAVDYLRKPIDVRELHQLIERIDSTLTVSAPTHASDETVDGLILHGETLRKIIALCDRFHAAKDLPCLIEGETGSGKELIARRIHHGGKPRINSPFIALNCAAITPGLFEAELFGYSAGAFTGALAGGAKGKLALAANGTLFLDELADLPLDQQAKLLRVLEERTWYPVGSTHLQTSSARIIGACNTDLLDRVRKGQFREDLYYRLKIGYVRVPALRERAEDIVALAEIFLSRIRKQRGRGFQKISSAAADVLRTYAWPGNVRQLHHVLEQLCVLHDGAVLDAEVLITLLPPQKPAEQRAVPPSAISPATPRWTCSPPDKLTTQQLPDEQFDLDAWQKAIVIAALEKYDGAPVRAAQYLGISRKVLYTLRKRYGLLSPNALDPAPEDL